MKHPIYNQKWIIGNFWVSTNKGKEVKEFLRSASKQGLNPIEILAPLQIAEKIEKNGTVLITAKKEELIDKVSINTLNQFTLKDFHYPFPAFSILFNDEILISFASEIEDLSGENKKISAFYLESAKYNKRLIGVIEKNKIIQDITKNSEKLLNEYIYAFFSLVLYMEHFKNDKKRVPTPRAVKQKAKLPFKIPKKLYVVNLKPPQPQQQETKKGGGEKRVMYLVRGHWRMQYYPSLKTHKPKWIDAHWRGLDNEHKNQKIYKL